MLVTTGCYVLPETIFDACRRLSPSHRGEYELSEAVDLLNEDGYIVDAVQLHGERVKVNRPADINLAEHMLGGGM